MSGRHSRADALQMQLIKNGEKTKLIVHEFKSTKTAPYTTPQKRVMRDIQTRPKEFLEMNIEKGTIPKNTEEVEYRTTTGNKKSRQNWNKGKNSSSGRIDKPSSGNLTKIRRVLERYGVRKGLKYIAKCAPWVGQALFIYDAVDVACRAYTGEGSFIWQQKILTKFFWFLFSLNYVSRCLRGSTKSD